jgi:hypothetical protein
MINDFLITLTPCFVQYSYRQESEKVAQVFQKSYQTPLIAVNQALMALLGCTD